MSRISYVYLDPLLSPECVKTILVVTKEQIISWKYLFRDMQRKDLNQHCLLCEVAATLCLLLFWEILLKISVFCLFQTFEDFKNDKQAVEYQQRIVDILLKVSVPKNELFVSDWLHAVLCSTACNLEEVFPVLPWLTPLRKCWAGAWIHLSQSCRLDIQKWWFMHFKYADREVSFPVISPGWCSVKFLISAPLSLFWLAAHWIYSLVSSELVKRSQVSCAWQGATAFLLNPCSQCL